MFKSDGCTIYGWLHELVYGTKPPFAKTACLKHDRAYWQGGSLVDKVVADLTLSDDLLKAGYWKSAIWVFVVLQLLTPILPLIPIPNWRWGGGLSFFDKHRWYL